MRISCETSWKTRSRGVTLIEVTAGLAVMSTLLVSVLIASAKLRTQAALAEVRVEACEVADGLLKEWWPEKDELPRNGEGVASGRRTWVWRTRPVASEDAETLGGEVIALEIFASADGKTDTEPAARVEILLAKEPELPEAIEATEERDAEASGTDTD